MLALNTEHKTVCNLCWEAEFTFQLTWVSAAPRVHTPSEVWKLESITDSHIKCLAQTNLNGKQQNSSPNKGAMRCLVM